MSDDILKRLKRLEKLVAAQAGAVSVENLAACLDAVAARIENDRLAVPLDKVNEVLDAALKDGVSIMLEKMDLDASEARLLVHGEKIEVANDLGSIDSVTELAFVTKPANSRCQ